MTKQECLSNLNKLPLVYLINGLLCPETIPYKPDNYEVLRSCQDEIKGLRIYRDVNKFRIIIKL